MAGALSAAAAAANAAAASFAALTDNLDYLDAASIEQEIGRASCRERV